MVNMNVQTSSLKGPFRTLHLSPICLFSPLHSPVASLRILSYFFASNSLVHQPGFCSHFHQDKQGSLHWQISWPLFSTHRDSQADSESWPLPWTPLLPLVLVTISHWLSSCVLENLTILSLVVNLLFCVSFLLFSGFYCWPQFTQHSLPRHFHQLLWFNYSEEAADTVSLPPARVSTPSSRTSMFSPVFSQTPDTHYAQNWIDDLSPNLYHQVLLATLVRIKKPFSTYFFFLSFFHAEYIN